MVTIYCIEDINGLKYVGSTKQKLNQRFRGHKCNKTCSSKLLDLENSKIYSLEECKESNRREREQHHINNTECVNKYKLNFNSKEYQKQYDSQHYKENKERRNQQQQQHYKENKERIKQHQKQYHHYQNSWGGNKRSHNNLLSINLSIFN